MRPPEVFVRELAPREGPAAQAAVEDGETRLDAAAGFDRARFGDVDERAADRAHVDDGRGARAQGDPRLQPARVRVAAPSFPGRATPPDLD
jgi:hypothetical protein